MECGRIRGSPAVKLARAACERYSLGGSAQELCGRGVELEGSYWESDAMAVCLSVFTKVGEID